MLHEMYLQHENIELIIVLNFVIMNSSQCTYTLTDENYIEHLRVC